MKVLGLLVENVPGVMQRISGVFARRGFNIETITVAHTNDPHVSRITLSLDGDEKVLEQAIKQLNRLPEVIKTSEFLPNNSVMREIALLKINANEHVTRGNVLDYVKIFRGHVVDIGKTTIMVEITGSSEKIDAFINLVQPMGIKEMVRTGITALVRGE